MVEQSGFRSCTPSAICPLRTSEDTKDPCTPYLPCNLTHSNAHYKRDTRNQPKIKHTSSKQKLAALFRSQSSRWSRDHPWQEPGTETLGWSRDHLCQEGTCDIHVWILGCDNIRLSQPR